MPRQKKMQQLALLKAPPAPRYAVHYMRSLSYPEPVCGIKGSCTITPDIARVTCAQCVKRAPVTLAAQPEKWLLAQVRALAKLHGWRVYHTWNSKHSEAGFPDVVLLKTPRLIFAELKREGETPTIEQQAWLDALATISGIEAYLWQPTDLPHIADLLAQFDVLPRLSTRDSPDGRSTS